MAYTIQNDLHEEEILSNEQYQTEYDPEDETLEADPDQDDADNDDDLDLGDADGSGGELDPQIDDEN